MPYADADFILALLKPSDWLKEGAERVLKARKGTIWTSLVAVLETLMVGKELGLNPERMVSDIVEIAGLGEREEQTALCAAVFMARDGLSTFDAFHAAFAADDAIISSDEVFDRVGLKRLPFR